MGHCYVHFAFVFTLKLSKTVLLTGTAVTRQNVLRQPHVRRDPRQRHLVVLRLVEKVATFEAAAEEFLAPHDLDEEARRQEGEPHLMTEWAGERGCEGGVRGVVGRGL